MIAKFKYYYLALILILTASIIFLTLKLNFKESSLTLDAKENRFFLNFDLKSGDKNNFNNILNKLDLPQSFVKGASFELDSTSSAALTYLVPIESKLDFDGNLINFWGKTSGSNVFTDNRLEKIKLPENANLLLYSENLVDFILVRNSFSEKFTIWLKDNFAKEPSGYLVVFGNQADYAIIIKDAGNDFSSLQDVFSQSDLEDSYRVETDNGISYHLIRAFQEESTEGKTLTIFKIDGWQILASSKGAALAIVDSIKNQAEAINFPPDDIDANSDFVVFYQNWDQFPINQNLVSLFLGTSNLPQESLEKLENYLQKIRLFRFSLKEDEFSGLIEFK